MGRDAARYLEVRGPSAGHLNRSYQRSYAAEHDGVTEKYVARLVGNAFRRGARSTASGHALRHTFATGLLKRAANLHDIRGALGHVSLSTTEIYLPYVTAREPRGLMDAPDPPPAPMRERASEGALRAS